MINIAFPILLARTRARGADSIIKRTAEAAPLSRMVRDMAIPLDECGPNPVTTRSNISPLATSSKALLWSSTSVTRFPRCLKVLDIAGSGRSHYRLPSRRRPGSASALGSQQAAKRCNFPLFVDFIVLSLLPFLKLPTFRLKPPWLIRLATLVDAKRSGKFLVRESLCRGPKHLVNREIQ